MIMENCNDVNNVIDDEVMDIKEPEGFEEEEDDEEIPQNILTKEEALKHLNNVRHNYFCYYCDYCNISSKCECSTSKVELKDKACVMLDSVIEIIEKFGMN